MTETEVLQKQINALKMILASKEIRNANLLQEYDNQRTAEETLDSEREMNRVLTEELEASKKRNVELLFALQACWPYVHKNCTINSVMNKVEAALSVDQDAVSILKDIKTEAIREAITIFHCMAKSGKGYDLTATPTSTLLLVDIKLKNLLKKYEY